MAHRKKKNAHYLRRLQREAKQSPPSQHWRPRTRAECVDLPRPCPYIGCRHHLGTYVTPAGSLRFEFGENAKLDALPATCALDVAAEGPKTLESIAALLNVTRERVRQIEEVALEKVAEYARAHGLNPGDMLLPDLEATAPNDAIATARKRLPVLPN